MPPAFRRVPPEPPENLSPEARAEWDRIIDELTRLGIVKAEDRAALSAHCEAWSRWVAATAIVNAEGVLHDTPAGTRRHPAVQVASDAARELRGWIAELGLSPSAEARLAPPVPDDEVGPYGAANPFA